MGHGGLRRATTGQAGEETYGPHFTGGAAERRAAAFGQIFGKGKGRARPGAEARHRASAGKKADGFYQRHQRHEWGSRGGRDQQRTRRSPGGRRGGAQREEKR